jgi:hypothetical protein
MRTRLARSVALAVAVAALSTADTLVAQPTCVAGTYGSYLALGSGGCTINGLRFADFAALQFARGGLSWLPSDIRVTPLSRDGWVGFAFDFRFALTRYSDSYLNTGTTTELGFGFGVVSGAISAIRGAAVGDSVSEFTTSGSSQASADAYWGASVGSGALGRGSDGTFLSRAEIPYRPQSSSFAECGAIALACTRLGSDAAIGFAPTSGVLVDLLHVAGGSGAPCRNPSFPCDFGSGRGTIWGSTIEFQVSAVPEPRSFALLLMGVVGLACVRTAGQRRGG